MTKICVFAGAQLGTNLNYTQAATELGRAIADGGHSLIYGGGKVGLMGCVAQSALARGAEVIGIIPNFLAHDEVLQDGLTETIIVEDLFQRKATMIKLSEVYVALPGGIGTFDELLEIMTWRQLNQINAPIGVLDINNYFEPLLAAFNHAVAEGFVQDRHISSIARTDDIGKLFELLEITNAPPSQ
ncbi:MAG: TIGR00730 family Rossman fold protein [Proteobacteria bacterium]|nr:TIGR00730 family Rossman fold protein [Pseudomonadota bacterium]